MAGTDRFDDKTAADGPSSGIADDVKLLLDQLAAQITDADKRHADSVHYMQERLANLSDRTTAAKPNLPDNCAKALDRVEDAMAALAGRLADVEPGARRDDPLARRDVSDIDEASRALPGEVRAEVRRAMYDLPQSADEAPPALRSALTDTGAGKAGHNARQNAPSRAFAAIEDEVDRGPPPSASTSKALDKGWDNPTALPPLRSYRSGPAAPRSADSPTEAQTTSTTDRAWLEARFADIAGRVEQSLARLDPHNSLVSIGARFDQLERRIDSALRQLSSPAGGDAEPLKAIETQITDLFTELDRAQKQLGRLDKIESRLAELRQSPSEEQMARLIGAMAPSDKHLAAIAEAAAERVAERLTGSPATATPSAEDPRLGELTTLMREFIGERRQGDTQTAEALDTMQLAMQHLIDRVEAIEAAQTTGHEELMRVAQTMAGRRTERSRGPLELGVRESNLTPTAVSSGSDELPRLAVVGAPNPPDGEETTEEGRKVRSEPRFDHVSHTAPHERDPATTSEAGPYEERSLADASPAGDLNRQAMIAMARRAAERVARGSPAPTTATDDEANGPMGWVRRLAGARAAGDHARSTRRPRILLVASFAAFLLAGFWMIAGTGLRGIIPGVGSERPASPKKAQGTSDAAPVSDDTTARAAAPARDEAASLDHRKAERDRPPSESAPSRLAATSHQPAGRSYPGFERVADGVGIVVDDGHRTGEPAAVLRAREQVRMASLSAKLGQAPPATVTTTAALVPASDGQGAMSRAVEMPPAMLGPLSLRHAAANGDPVAQLEIAARFAEGKGVTQDFAQAATWYQRAAAQGHAAAQYRLGALYDRGLGVPADPARARVWYGRAAAQGNIRAMHNLAVLSASNADGRPNYPTAIQWFSEAANRGLADSQYNLGILYESGLGVPTSLVDAYKWYALAARSGDKDAIRRRDAVRSRLDTARVAAADKVIIEWRAKPVEAVANDARNAGQIWRAQPSAGVVQSH